jgi:hypothetical protein
MARGSRKALDRQQEICTKIENRIKIRLMKVSILKDWLGIIKLSMI